MLFSSKKPTKSNSMVGAYFRRVLIMAWILEVIHIHDSINRYYSSLKYNEIRTKVIMTYIHMCLIFLIWTFVTKYQIITYFSEVARCVFNFLSFRVGAHLRGWVLIWEGGRLYHWLSKEVNLSWDPMHRIELPLKDSATIFDLKIIPYTISTIQETMTKFKVGNNFQVLISKKSSATPFTL